MTEFHVVTQVYTVEERVELEEQIQIPFIETKYKFYDRIKVPNLEMKEKLESTWAKVNFTVEFKWMFIYIV